MKDTKQGISDPTKVLVTTEGFMSEVRSWSVPVQQLSGWPTAAGTGKLNSLIFIRSKTPLYLVMTDQSASITARVPIITAFKILMGTAQTIFSLNPATQVQVKLCPGVSQHHTIQPWCSAL